MPHSCLSIIVIVVAMTLGHGRASAAPDFDHLGLAVEALERVIRPGAGAFAEAAGKLRDSLAALCNAPDKQHLRSARKTFADTIRAYGHIELLRFGPNREKSRGERLLLYPDPKGLVRRQVEKVLTERDATVLAAGTLYGKSVTLQGFPALEQLLSAETGERLLASDDDARFRCGYAAAIGANVAAIAAAIRDGWNNPEGFAKLMVEPSVDNPAYLKQSEVTLEIAQAFINGIETVRDQRIASPLGLRALDKAPTIGVLETSGLSLVLVEANIEGLRDLYRDGGLEPRLARHSATLAALVGRELETALASLRAVRVDLAKARQTPKARQSLIALGFPLKNAQQQAAALTAEASGLSIGFNAGDGD